MLQVTDKIDLRNTVFRLIILESVIEGMITFPFTPPNHLNIKLMAFESLQMQTLNNVKLL